MDLDIFDKYFYKNEQEQRILLNNQFTGIQYRLADNWFSLVNVNDFKNKPINYLEIGTFYGANIISVAKTYGLHNDSKLYCIDPWEDYDEYSNIKINKKLFIILLLKILIIQEK